MASGGWNFHQFGAPLVEVWVGRSGAARLTGMLGRWGWPVYGRWARGMPGFAVKAAAMVVVVG